MQLKKKNLWRKLRIPGMIVLLMSVASVMATAPDKASAPGHVRPNAGSPVATLPVSAKTGSVQLPATASESARTGVAADSGVRLVFRSYEVAAISAEINARITYLPGREGDQFRKGDLLVEFDCSRIAAEYEAAQATFDAHRIAYESRAKLLRYQAAGALGVEQARFEMKKAQADAFSLKARRGGCMIRAPFDGRVAEKIAQPHEVSQPNQPLIRIVNDARLEFVLMTPSSQLASFSKGMRFNVRVDETGEVHAARIVQSTGLIDPVSQSARLIGELVAQDTSVLPGMSGTAILSRSEAAQ